MDYGYYTSPVGLVEVGSTEEAIASVYFVETHRHAPSHSTLIDEALRQLADYFNGTRRSFDLPLAFSGTEFQQAVWRQLLTIPYGETVSYLEIASALGNLKAVRAVGAANGQNPISIIAPCHRVIGSNGKLVGYGGGLWRKEWLLRHEGALLV
jgi:methylated-DNA-[protein]-cysteine S-methyltransferase